MTTDWMEAWLSGYNACRAGVPNDESILTAMQECFERSGPELARKTVEGGLTDADRERIAELRPLAFRPEGRDLA